MIPKGERGSTRRRLDAVRLVSASDPAIVRFSPGEFRRRLAGARVELIEAKPSLNRGVIGQVVAGISSADANGNREQVQVTAEA